MGDIKRIDKILQLLKVYWLCNPDLRLGQIINNITPTDESTYFIEDDKVEEILKDLLKG